MATAQIIPAPPFIPRRIRSQRVFWNTAAKALDTARNQAPMLPTLVRRGFTSMPYLVAHPEREIAFTHHRSWYCPKCGVGRTADAWLTNGEANTYVTTGAEMHNAEHHPRRWAHRWDAR